MESRNRKSERDQLGAGVGQQQREQGALGGQSYNAGRVSLRWLASENVEVNLIGDLTNDSSEAGPEVLLRAVQTIAPTDARYIQVNGVPLDCRFVPNGPFSCDPNGRNQKYISYATFNDNLPPPLSDRMMPELPRDPRKAPFETALATNPRLRSLLSAIAVQAERMVCIMFVPVSPSGTGYPL